MRVLKIILVALLALGFLESKKLAAQPLTAPVQITPDCGPIFFDFSANASSAQFDNRFIGCKTWYVAYTSTGFPALTLTFQSAPDASGIPGAWAAFAGTVVEGVNPNVALTQASTIMYGYFPWQRITLGGAVAGVGRRIRGTFYGYRQTPVATVILPAAVTVTADQGAPNTDANRWPVYLSDGAAAQGVVGNPFFTRLSDGAAAQGTQTNPLFGRLSDGTNPIGTATNPLAEHPYLWNGTAWVLQPVCNLSAVITIAGAGTLEIVALTPAQRIRVCHLSVAYSEATNMTVVEGTGVNCAGAPANLTGAYTNILGVALDLGDRSQLQTTAANALCITTSAGVTGGGVVTYAKY